MKCTESKSLNYTTQNQYLPVKINIIHAKEKEREDEQEESISKRIACDDNYGRKVEMLGKTNVITARGSNDRRQ